MRGMIYLAAGLAAASPSLASIGWSYASAADTAMYINGTSGTGIAAQGAVTGIQAYGHSTGIEAEGFSGQGVKAKGRLGVWAEGVQDQGFYSGHGVYAYGPVGGVYAEASNVASYGVSGNSTGENGIGVKGTADVTGYAVGVHGVANYTYNWDAIGVKGESTDGVGVKGYSSNYGTAVLGDAYYGLGVRGQSVNWSGVSGSGPTGVEGQGIGAYSIAVTGNSDYSHPYTAYAGMFYGNVAVTGDCDPCSPSDGRFKKNVNDMNGALKKILALKPKSYEMKTDEFKTMGFTPGVKYGLMAEDVRKVLPELVHALPLPAKKDEKGAPIKDAPREEYQAIAYSKLIPVLIGAIQELQAEVDALKKAR